MDNIHRFGSNVELGKPDKSASRILTGPPKCLWLLARVPQRQYYSDESRGKGEKSASVFMSILGSMAIAVSPQAIAESGKPRLVQGRTPILPAVGSCKIERPERSEGQSFLEDSSGHSILQPPAVGKIGEESPNTQPALF